MNYVLTTVLCLTLFLLLTWITFLVCLLVHCLSLSFSLLMSFCALGFIYRRKSRIFICERLLELALQSRDEILMQRALARPKELKVTSRLIQLYRKHIKQLMLEIMNEKYVINSLNDAITIRSLPLLSSAISLAKENNMLYLPEITYAKQIYQELSNHRILLSFLSDELSKCLTMSTLMKKYDILSYLIKESMKYDLQGEKAIRDTTIRLEKIENLFNVRQSLRHALEICSPTKMIKSLKERNKLVRMFGDDFLADEVIAIDKMMNMLNFKQTLLTTNSKMTIASGASDIDDDGEAEESADDKGEDDTLPQDGDENEGEENDAVSPIAEKKKDKERKKAKKTEKKSIEIETEETTDIEERRWNMHEIYHYVIHNNSNSSTISKELFQIIQYLTDSYNDASKSSTAAGHEGNRRYSFIHSLPEDKDFIYLPRFVRDPLGRMRLAKNPQGKGASTSLPFLLYCDCSFFCLLCAYIFSFIFLSFFIELDDAVAEFVKLVPNEFHRKFYLRIYKWTIAFATWNQPNPELLAIQKSIYPFSNNKTMMNGDTFSPSKTAMNNNGFSSPVKSPSQVSLVVCIVYFLLCYQPPFSSFCFDLFLIRLICSYYQNTKKKQPIVFVLLHHPIKRKKKKIDFLFHKIYVVIHHQRIKRIKMEDHYHLQRNFQ
jgi:hypothetical protein